MRLVGAAVAVVVTLVLMAAPASAHTGGGPQPTNYRSELIGVVPPAPGVSAELSELGKRIRLENTGPTDVVVVGYQNEPYLRIGPSGVYENTKSPTLYRNRTVAGGGAATVPDTADPSAPPEWHKVSSGHTASWGDDRTKHTGAEPSAVRQDPGHAHVVVPQWSIPLRQGAADLAVVGTLSWVPGTSVLPWLMVAVVLAALVVLAGRCRRWGPALSIATAILVAVDVVLVVALATASSRGPGGAAVQLLSGSYLSIGAWMAGIAAVFGLQQEKEGGLLAACFCGAVIAVMSGVTDLASLTRSQLPVALPTGFVRLGVAVALGMGTGLVVAAATRIAKNPAEGPVQVSSH
jgi:hypothetical protein